jgi:hypothetical protein
MNTFLLVYKLKFIAVVNYRVPVELPAGGKKYPSHIRLDSGRLRVPPTGKKLSPYPIAIPNSWRVTQAEPVCLDILFMKETNLSSVGRAEDCSVTDKSLGRWFESGR